MSKRLRPYPQGSGRPLLGEDEFPIVKAQSRQIAIVGEIEEFLARAFCLFACEIWEKIIAVEMDLIGLLEAHRIASDHFWAGKVPHGA